MTSNVAILSEFTTTDARMIGGYAIVSANALSEANARIKSAGTALQSACMAVALSHMIDVMSRDGNIGNLFLPHKAMTDIERDACWFNSLPRAYNRALVIQWLEEYTPWKLDPDCKAKDYTGPVLFVKAKKKHGVDDFKVEDAAAMPWWEMGTELGEKKSKDVDVLALVQAVIKKAEKAEKNEKPVQNAALVALLQAAIDDYSAAF